MKIEQTVWTPKIGWQPGRPGQLAETAQLVFVFGGTQLFKTGERLHEIRQAYPQAHFFGCSTAGEIAGTQVSDDSLVVTAIHFEHTQIKGAQITVAGPEESYQAGERLGQMLEPAGLVHAFVLSEGVHINGSELVQGLTKHLPVGVTATGGLSGDGERMQETYVLWNHQVLQNSIGVLGFYGNRLKVGYGSLGGWDTFGPTRLITRSQGNVLYEMDGKSALELYKRYLGDHAQELPAAGLLFPLSLRTRNGKTGVVRTVLAVNEAEQSMTFAGDVPEGSYVQLMKANFDRLIDGASGAARTSYEAIGSASPDLAILISCVGRKMVLKQRIEEEVESVHEVLGAKTALTGFYSYGEISPFTPNATCELHNQTMTITTWSEN